jgi:LPXTG-motif cell wall-anchored protein
VVSGNNPYSLSLVAGSVELYEEDDNHELSVDGNGAIAKGKPVSNSAWSYEYKEDGKDQDNAYKYNTLSVKIPDGKHLYLLYAYDMDCSIKNADFTLNSNDFSNTATISGVATDTSDKQLTWQISSTKAGGSSGKVHTFRKVEAGKNNKTLAGAVFSLWVYDKENTSWKDTGITYTSSDSDLDFGTFSVSMSGGTGASESYDYQYNTAYYLVEEEAPEGYKTPETTTKYYFYFSGDENEYPLNMPDYFRDANGSYNPIDISTDSGTTDIKNEPILTIKKVWLGADDGEITPDESLVVTVEVYQNHGDDSTLYKTIELKKDNQWTAELDNLDQYDSENKLCTYSVKEISVKNADGTDLTSLYKDPKYTNNNVVPGNEITITNQLATQYTLPKTGGTGRNLLYMFGGLLTLGAGFLLIYRKHKII